MLSIGLCVARKFLTRGVDVGLGIRNMKKGKRRGGKRKGVGVFLLWTVIDKRLSVV
jgi:hypothetical protein